MAQLKTSREMLSFLKDFICIGKCDSHKRKKKMENVFMIY